MMFWEDMDRRARRLGILDTKLAQGAAVFFALTVVKLFPEVLTLSIWWFVGLSVACAIRPVVTFFGHDRMVSAYPSQR
ncbi:MAG: hypothetical protein WBO54_10015 [Thermoanaerobaculia bacterium]|jgi:hypothetical protein